MYYEHLILLQITAERMINELKLVALLIQTKKNKEKSYERKNRYLNAFIDSNQQLVNYKSFDCKMQAK